jgi:hypothetical protein
VAQYIISTLIPDVPREVDIQLDRQRYLNEDIIFRVSEADAAD